MAALTLATVLPAHASWMMPGQPIRPKDFALVKRDGLYHLFYIRRNLQLPQSETEKDLGHAVSRDLWVWQQRPPVLAVRDSAWDNDHVWAPSIVLEDGVYYMFYTGVSSIPDVHNEYQRTGLATSTDLETWNRFDQPVFTCVQAPSMWCDSLQTAMAFRDPFVMRDPLNPGRWLMYTSTFPASDTAGMVVGLAASSGDFTSWTDLGPLWITHHTYSWNTITESPHVFHHAGLWYLFYTTNAGQPLSFATSPDPSGPVEQWTYRGRLATMLGLDTQAWYASEHLADGKVDYFAFVIADRIEFYRMVWSSDWRFSLAQPDFMHVYAMSWDRDAVEEGEASTLSICATSWSSRAVDLEVVEVDADGSEEPVPALSVGIPSRVTLKAETTTVRCVVGAWPDSGDTDPRAELRVRIVDHTAAAPVLAVNPAPPPPPPPIEPSGDPLEVLRNGMIEFRALARHPLPSGPAFLLDLPEEMDGRVDLYDVHGRHVRNLAERRLPAGASVLAWDGRDGAGRAAGPGVYFARFTGGGVARTARVVLTR